MWTENDSRKLVIGYLLTYPSIGQGVEVGQAVTELDWLEGVNVSVAYNVLKIIFSCEDADIANWLITGAWVL